MESITIASDSNQPLRYPSEESTSRKIKKGFIKYLHFPREISLNCFRKYGVYCPNLDYGREKHLPRSSSSIKGIKFIRSSKLNFPNRGASNTNLFVFDNRINKELKNLSRMINYAKGLHSFTLYLNDYDLRKGQILYIICEKLKGLKKISSMTIQLLECNTNEAEMDKLSKMITTQKKLSKLDISYRGDSFLKTGFISLNKTIASYKNLSDLRVYLGRSSQQLPSTITNQFFSELSRLTELKALTLVFSRAVNTDKGFFESITECFKNLKHLQRLSLIFQACNNMEDENMQVLAQQLSEFNELSHLSLNLARCTSVNTVIEDISNSIQTLKNIKSFCFHLTGCPKVDEKVLYSSLQNISTQTSLTDLTLNFEEINLPGSFILLGNLIQLKNLDLNFSSLTNGNISLISQALSCLKGLESFRLYIYRSNELDTSAYCLADALTSLTKLKSLTLTFPSAMFLTDNFCNYLKEPLSKLQELECLDLQFPSSQFANQGTVEIASALASLRKLFSLKLNFYNCKNEDKSLEMIGNAILNMNKIRLLSLTFSNSLVTSQGILSIGRTISKLHDLKDITLKFSSCKYIEDYSVKRLCESLKGLKQLQYLDVNFEGSTSNEFEKEVVVSLKNSLPFLKRFYFLATNIYPEVLGM